MKKILLLTSMCLLAVASWAQPQPPQEGGQGKHFDPQKFQQYVEASLTKEAGLTADEAKAFFPLYNEMRQKQRALGDGMRKLKQIAPGATEKDYQTSITRIKRMQVEMAELEADYYKRMCKAISPEKVFRVMQAEDKFHRQMVRGKGPGGPDRKGQHGQKKQGKPQQR